MKASEAEILIIPGHQNAGPDHWQSRWQSRLSSARRVEQADWDNPERAAWSQSIVEAIRAAEKPVVLVGHSIGIPAAIHAVPQVSDKIAGAFLVAPPDIFHPLLRPKSLREFGPYPREPLPFPSIVVASRNDPYASYEHAGDIANAWGSLLVDAGQSGHLNAASGHGPWPEGTMVFAQFLSRLKP
jgi:uncharacterized protein